VINDFRTRLLNLDSVTAQPIAEYGFIDSKFQPERLTVPVSILHAALYPTSDLKQRALLTKAYLKLIDAALLSEYVVCYDSRITYDLTGTFDDVLSSDMKEIMDSAMRWTDAYGDWLLQKFKQVPPSLAMLYRTYSDELLKFCALLLIVFGRF